MVHWHLRRRRGSIEESPWREMPCCEAPPAFRLLQSRDEVVAAVQHAAERDLSLSESTLRRVARYQDWIDLLDD
jgi:hypothetical protein